MSSATKEILGRVRQLVPPMLDKFHKGESTPLELGSGWGHCEPLRKGGRDTELTTWVKCRAAGPHRSHRRQ